MVESGGLSPAVFIAAGTAGMLLLVMFLLLFMLLYQRKANRQREAHQRALLQAEIRARESERRQISMELHDEVQLDLNTVQMGLNRLGGEAEPAVKEELAELSGGLLRTIQRIRHLSRQMYPSVLRRAGLPAALEELCRETGRSGIEVHWHCRGAYRALPEAEETALYRVVQELFSNALKHSGCSRITLLLRYGAKQLELMVGDNGKGFGPGGDAPLQEGLGMEHIRVRMESIGAAYAFESRPGEGVSFRAVLGLGHALPD